MILNDVLRHARSVHSGAPSFRGCPLGACALFHGGVAMHVRTCASLSCPLPPCWVERTPPAPPRTAIRPQKQERANRRKRLARSCRAGDVPRPQRMAWPGLFAAVRAATANGCYGPRGAGHSCSRRAGARADDAGRPAAP